jgi:lysophospholipase L1-like esterase
VLRDFRRGTTGVRLKLALLALSLLATLGLLEVATWGLTRSGARANEFAVYRSRYLQDGVPQYIAHPFLVVTRNPLMPHVNRLGFTDHEWTREKPPGTLRIACLGASTTEDGYPALVAERLAQMEGLPPVEVMNFGVSGWLSNQSLINYALNVQHFAPDIVVVHHGANDHRVRGYPDFRTDYAHAIRSLPELRPPFDALLVARLRSYAAARMLADKLRKRPPGGDLEKATRLPRSAWAGFSTEELRVFQSNIGSIVRLARAGGARSLVVTQPYSRTRGFAPSWTVHMGQINQASRELAQQEQVDLVDLEVAMAGDESIFTDPIHLTQAVGIPRKAELVAERLAIMLRNRP